jgi:hypothetical protein
MEYSIRAQGSRHAPTWCWYTRPEITTAGIDLPRLARVSRGTTDRYEGQPPAIFPCASIETICLLFASADVILPLDRKNMSHRDAAPLVFCVVSNLFANLEIHVLSCRLRNLK